MRLLSIDNYVANLNVLVDELGGAVDLVGLCQGGWMALTYAARFPTKVRKLVLAGAPIDIAAGNSKLSDLAGDIIWHLQGVGRPRGRPDFGASCPTALGFKLLDREAVHHLLQSPDAIGSAAVRRLEARFREWYAWTVDLPGPNTCRSSSSCSRKTGWLAAASRFGPPNRSAGIRCPLFLIAARDDDVVASEQIFATAHLVDTRHCGSREAPRRAGISACSWAGRSWPRSCRNRALAVALKHSSLPSENPP